jgi:hypothetical protein
MRLAFMWGDDWLARARLKLTKPNQATLVESRNYQLSTMNFQLILEASTYGKAVGSS